MAIPEPTKFPLEMACPECRFVVWVTEKDAPVGDVATCPKCHAILEKTEVVTQRIIDESTK